MNFIATQLTSTIAAALISKLPEALQLSDEQVQLLEEFCQKELGKNATNQGRKLADKTEKKATRGPTGYQLFCKEQREVFKEKGKEYTMGECSKVCSAKWKQVSDKEKEEWKNKAKEIVVEPSQKKGAKKTQKAKKTETEEVEFTIGEHNGHSVVFKNEKPTNFLCNQDGSVFARLKRDGTLAKLTSKEKAMLEEDINVGEFHELDEAGNESETEYVVIENKEKTREEDAYDSDYSKCENEGHCVLTRNQKPTRFLCEKNAVEITVYAHLKKDGKVGRLTKKQREMLEEKGIVVGEFHEPQPQKKGGRKPLTKSGSESGAKSSSESEKSAGVKRGRKPLNKAPAKQAEPEEECPTFSREFKDVNGEELLMLANNGECTNYICAETEDDDDPIVVSGKLNATEDIVVLTAKDKAYLKKYGIDFQ
jgi:hypothetical protein